MKLTFLGAEPQLRIDTSVGALVEFSVKWTTADVWPASRPGTP